MARMTASISPGALLGAGALSLVAAVVAAPAIATFTSFGAGGGETQAHIWSTAGPEYLRNTALLCVIVALGVASIGVATAALTSLFEFPGRRLFAPLLAAPLAIPAYVGAYAYADLFSPGGAVYEAFGVFGAKPPALRNLFGAGLVLSLTTFPYVHLAASAAFSARSANAGDAARLLGAGAWRTLFSVHIPLARAAIVGGVALALMETAADFGVADYFGVPTLSVGIFRTWYGLGDLTAASQLAAGLFLVALIALLLEEYSRQGARSNAARSPRAPRRTPLAPLASVGATVFCASVFFISFVTPVAVLFTQADWTWGATAQRGLGQAIVSTAIVAAGAASLIAAMSLAFALFRRWRPGVVVNTAIRAATLGYAMPGAVVAIGVLYCAAALPFGGAAVAAGPAALIFAYIVRFLTIGYNAASASLEKVDRRIDDAARSLGAGAGRIAARIHGPLAGRGLAVGAMIAMVDIAKELPATLILRSFNFETLSTRVYRLASDERLADAAPPALILIGLGVVILSALTSATARK